jgi:hypothetical protein
MGWYVVPEKYENELCKHQQHFVSHTGGAIGASRILPILPTQETGKQDNLHCVEKYGKQSVPPQGDVYMNDTLNFYARMARGVRALTIISAS